MTSCALPAKELLQHWILKIGRQPGEAKETMETFYSSRLDWEALGYSAPRTPTGDAKLRQDPDRALWIQLEETLHQAKMGNFTQVLDLLDLYKNAQSAVFQYVCSRVLGDAGTTECFERMIREIESDDNDDVNKALHYCSAFRAWGALSCVPVLVKQYERFRSSGGSSIILIYLSSLLEPKWDAIAEELSREKLAEYRDVVMNRYSELKERFKTDRVIILEGEVASVKLFAKLLLNRLSKSDFNRLSQPFLRRKFEASTGIDCSGFFKEKRFQPLAAAAILQEFLETGQADKYAEGVRYFFGHRMPG